jgi:TetR/AcrR family transcriptional repressor of mexJK operon
MKKKANISAQQDTVARSRLSEERVDRLLEVAAEVFAENGYERASVGEMAERADASKATFYRRFGTKEALLMAVVSRQVQGLETNLASLMRPELGTSEALTTFATTMLEVVLSDQVLSSYRVVTMEALRFPELGKMYYDNGVGKIAKLFADYLSRQTEKRSLKVTYPQIAAEQFIDAVVGLPRLRAALGIGRLSNGEKAQRIAIAVEAFLMAYGAKESGKSR